jgi:hypothetical protein
MSDKTNPALSSSQKREAVAMIECLAYLEGIAAEAGFRITAHLISLARTSTENMLKNETGAESLAAPTRQPERGRSLHERRRQI